MNTKTSLPPTWADGSYQPWHFVVVVNTPLRLQRRRRPWSCWSFLILDFWPTCGIDGYIYTLKLIMYRRLKCWERTVKIGLILISWPVYLWAAIWQSFQVLQKLGHACFNGPPFSVCLVSMFKWDLLCLFLIQYNAHCFRINSLCFPLNLSDCA